MQARYKPPHEKSDGRDLKSAPASTFAQQLRGNLDHELLQPGRLLNRDFRPVGFSRHEHEELAGPQNQLRRRGSVICEFLGVGFRLEEGLFPKGLYRSDVDAFDSLDKKLQIDRRLMVFPCAEASYMPKKNQAASVMIRKNKETDPLAARAVALTE